MTNAERFELAAWNVVRTWRAKPVGAGDKCPRALRTDLDELVFAAFKIQKAADNEKLNIARTV